MTETIQRNGGEARATVGGTGGTGGKGTGALGGNAVHGNAIGEEQDVSTAARAVLQVLKEWPGQEKRATLIQLLDKWKPEKVWVVMSVCG